ncbi:Poly-beta-hydroxybutyrate polymerase [Sphingomonas antarctica]|uniref:alpha/beta fold hydrolase n=1 Tax=Sphingomonas antarctica TaxID=2040274 RepID=UPI0039E8D187
MADADPIGFAATEFERALQRNIKGMGYWASPAPVLGASAKDEILSRGPMRVYHYQPRADEVYRVPVLLVMATTNRGYIFDMVPGQSLVEFLLDRGYDVFMLDWEAPRAEDRALDLEAYALDFVGAAVAKVKETTGEEDVSLLGYCFGGVLSLIWSAIAGQGLKNLATFTTPVDFSGMPLFQAWADKRFFDVDRMVDTLGMAPAEYLYTAFDMLRPGARLAGNYKLLDNMWNDEFVKSHRMFDRWSSDMLPLAGEYFRETTKKLMWDNALFEGRLEVGGRRVNLGEIAVPFLHVTAEHDHIVPEAASAPLIDMVGSEDKEAIVLKGGHVSLVAGGNAIKRLWPAIDKWLGVRST